MDSIDSKIKSLIIDLCVIDDKLVEYIKDYDIKAIRSIIQSIFTLQFNSKINNLANEIEQVELNLKETINGKFW